MKLVRCGGVFFVEMEDGSGEIHGVELPVPEEMLEQIKPFLEKMAAEFITESLAAEEAEKETEEEKAEKERLAAEKRAKANELFK